MSLLLLLLAPILTLIAGLNVKPRPFPPYPASPTPPETMPLPEDLPEPVHRFYQRIYGDHVPVIKSAVITLSGTLRLGPIPFPARLRFVHRAGRDYRHYIEATLFGLPVMKVNEHYRDGIARMELPFARIDDDAYTNAAANMGLWGESLWFPSLYLTDERVRWEAINPDTARLIVPYPGGGPEAQEQVFTVHFDPQTTLIRYAETMRYRDSSGKLIRWTLHCHHWRMIDGTLIAERTSVQWGDQAKPWLDITIDDIKFNINVSEYIQQRGL